MATGMPAGINISQATASVTVMSPSGEVDLGKCTEIETMFASYFSPKAKNWLIDLRSVDYFDSDGVMLLQRCVTKIRKAGGRVAIICHQTGLTARVLSLSKMTQEVECFHDMTPAIGYVGSG